VKVHDCSIEGYVILFKTLINFMVCHFDFSMLDGFYILQFYQENDMSNEENGLAVLEQKLLQVECCISHNREQLVGIQKESEEKGDIIVNYKNSYDRNHIVVERKQNYMDECNRKLAKLLEKRDVSENTDS